MHKLVIAEMVESVRRRIAQGDCPTEVPFSREQLENALVDLADTGTAQAQPGGVPCAHSVVRHAKNWQNETDWLDSWWCKDCDARFAPLAALEAENADLREAAERAATVIDQTTNLTLDIRTAARNIHETLARLAKDNSNG